MKKRIFLILLCATVFSVSSVLVFAHGVDNESPDLQPQTVQAESDVIETEPENNNYNKLDKELKEIIQNSDNKTVLSVMIWIKGIDNEKIEEQARKATNYYADLQDGENTVDNLTEVFDSKNEEDIIKYFESTKEERRKQLSDVQEFLRVKRELAREEHIKANSKFIEDYKITDIIYMCKYAPVIIAKVSVSEILALIENDDVVEVGFYYIGKTELENNTSIPTINAPYNMNNIGLTGYGVRIGQIDGGVPDTSNGELSNSSITELSTNVSSHATLVASIIVGNNGLVPDAQLYSTDIGNFINRAEMLIEYNVQIINLSAGFSVNSYDQLSKLFDHFIYDENVLVIKSAGNNGTDSYVTSPGLAYNCITVGGIDDNNTTTMSDNTLAEFTCTNYFNCRKPEVYAPAVDISSAGLTDSGTSFAAPHVTGLIAQLIEATPSIASNPRLIKALVMAGGHDFTGNTYNKTETYTSEYCAGLVDAKKSFQISANSKYVTGTLTTDSEYTKTLNIPSSWSFIRVALVWDMKMTEQEALNDGNGTLADMDVALIDPNGVIVDGSFGVGNAFEFFNYPITEPGTYRLVVIRRGTDTTSQRFALVWY